MKRLLEFIQIFNETQIADNKSNLTSIMQPNISP